MKPIFALILTTLLLCGTLAPAVLAADEPTISADTETPDTVMDADASSPADADGSTDGGTPSDVGTVIDSDENNGGSDKDDQLLSGSEGSPSAPTGTEYSPVPEGFDYTGSVISLTTPDAFSSTFDIDCGDTGFTQLHNDLDSICIYSTVEKDSALYALSLSVTWDFSTVDASTPGIYSALGRISVPAGATMTDGLENMISISVQVASPVPSAITLTRFDEPNRTDAVAFAIGTSQEELSAWFADSIAGFTAYDSQGNTYDLLSGTWSLDAVDTSTTGVYSASVAPDLGKDYALADGVSLPRQLCAVSVQTTGEPDINCCVSARGFLHFPWVISAEQQEQLDEFAVWLRQDGAEWIHLSEGFCLTSGDLQLSQRIFEYGSTYDLKVTYLGGQTGVLTFRYDGQLSIIDYSGGDRDGGDANGSESPTDSQPAPTPSPTPDDSQNDDNHNNNGDTPAQDNSPSTSNRKLSDSVSTPKKSQDEPPSVFNEPQAEQDSSSREIQPEQTTLADNPTSLAPATPTESTPVYSNASFSHELESAAMTPGSETYRISQQQDNTIAVMNPVPININTQPEPVFESQKPESTVSESYSPTETVISGLRLRDLCADEESVVFGSGDLTVSIPSKLLLALNLSNSDTLSVKLTQPESNQIVLAVKTPIKSVTELSGTVFRLRYMAQSEYAEITVRNEAGEAITDAAYDGEHLYFTANAAGTYTILEMSKTHETQNGLSPLLPMSGGLILATGGITFFWRRHHG